VQVLHPRWSPWSFLLYAGSLTTLSAAGFLLAYFSDRHGPGVYTLLALLVFVLFAFVARALRRDGTHPIAAGLFGLSSVVLFSAFVYALYSWFGWIHSSESAFGGFDLARLTWLLFTLIAALVALSVFHFPLILLIAVGAAWFFVTDLISGGGNWSAFVTFFVGLAFLGVARNLDGGPSRPYGMWVHVGAGLTIGGSLLWFFHRGDFRWALIAVVGVLFAKLAEAFGRTSWAILGTIGILLAATHFAARLTHAHFAVFGLVPASSTTREWAPAFVFGIAGVVLLVLGGRMAQRSR
jgi:hypothetical protein